MLHHTFAQIVQIRLPLPGLGEIFRHAFGKKNVPGIGAIHDSLSQINSGARDVRSLINISYLTDGTTMNAHTKLDARMIFQGLADLERTLDRSLGAIEEDKGHSVADGQANELAACFSRAELLGAPHNLAKLFLQFMLIVNQQL
jgi:hypothetical protein